MQCPMHFFVLMYFEVQAGPLPCTAHRQSKQITSQRFLCVSGFFSSCSPWSVTLLFSYIDVQRAEDYFQGLYPVDIIVCLQCQGITV